jgi:hypothetical protein
MHEFDHRHPQRPNSPGHLRPETPLFEQEIPDFRHPGEAAIRAIPAARHVAERIDACLALSRHAKSGHYQAGSTVAAS